MNKKDIEHIIKEVWNLDKDDYTLEEGTEWFWVYNDYIVPEDDFKSVEKYHISQWTFYTWHDYQSMTCKSRNIESFLGLSELDKYYMYLKYKYENRTS